MRAIRTIGLVVLLALASVTTVFADDAGDFQAPRTELSEQAETWM